MVIIINNILSSILYSKILYTHKRTRLLFIYNPEAGTKRKIVVIDVQLNESTRITVIIK